MKRIEVLSQSVADQIAAGEVAERPSAVVKELVENAIDAGATQVDVEIKNGGIELIRVTDNGSGIPADQVETAFLRHATSKLVTIDDLYKIGTMGFRGEALASICAVAEVEVITKTKDSEEGTYLLMEHGIPKEKEPIATADGTTMMVKKLFANVPARMKFLKKNSTESGYVTDVLGRIALSRPDIAFSCVCDDKEVFSTMGDGKLENVILRLYDLNHAKGIMAVDYKEDNVHISGVVGKPELSRGNRTRQTLFVNGRYIKSHVIGKVVEEAYRNAVMVGKFPFFVLSINLPSELVDVNVHPAKTEIKLANEKHVYNILYHAVRNAITSVNQPTEEKVVPKTEYRFTPKDQTTQKSSSGTVMPRRVETEKVNPETVAEFMEKTLPVSDKMVLKEPEHKSAEEILDEILATEIKPKEDKVYEQEIIPEFTRNEIEEKPIEAQIIGQVFDTYIICQNGEEMYLIDQHAAHERFRFEKLKEGYLKKERLTQMLLTPMVLNFDYKEKQAIIENIDQYKAFGFEIEDFGTNAVIVNGTPISGDEKAIQELILELNQAMEDNVKRPVADFEEKALDMISCKYAIKANKRLSLPEMQDLVKKVWMLEEKGAATCPHGRPIKVLITKTEIEKMFKRRV